MTKDTKSPDLTLPFNPDDLLSVRVSQAEFARMTNVTRSTVSRWLRDGKILAAPDGLIDPKQAMRQLIANSDPGRMRARVLKNATMEHAALRDKVGELEQALKVERERGALRGQAERNAEADRQAQALCLFLDTLADEWDEAQAAHKAGTLAEHLDGLAGAVFYGLEPGEE